MARIVLPFYPARNLIPAAPEILAVQTSLFKAIHVNLVA
jgi:hypothetical protein